MPSKIALSPMGNLRRGGQDSQNDKSFWARTFSKLDAGSLRGSIFALSASAIGSGVLSLPYVLNLCGWVSGITFLFVGAFGA